MGTGRTLEISCKNAADAKRFAEQLRACGGGGVAEGVKVTVDPKATVDALSNAVFEIGLKLSEKAVRFDVMWAGKVDPEV